MRSLTNALDLGWLNRSEYGNARCIEFAHSRFVGYAHLCGHPTVIASAAKQSIPRWPATLDRYGLRPRDDWKLIGI